MKAFNTRALVAGVLSVALAFTATAAHATAWSHVDTVDTDAGNRFLGVSATGTAVVVSHDSDSVTLFSAETGSYIATVTVGDGPTMATFSKNGKTLVVLNETAGTVSVVDVDTHSVTSTFNVEEGARSVAIAPNGKTVYSGNYLDRFLNIYSLRLGLLIRQIDMGSADNKWISFSKSGKTAFVSDRGAHQIAIVNVKKHKNVFDIPLNGGTPGNTALSPNGRFIAVPLFDDSLGIKIVDLKLKQVVKHVETPGHNPQSVVFSPDGNTLYATDSATGTIWTIDIPSLTLVDTDVVWSGGLNGLILNAAGTVGYLSNSNVNSLWKVTIS